MISTWAAWIMSKDAPTLSAYAAAAAALAAATVAAIQLIVAGIQLYVGHRQSKAALQSAHAALMSAQSAGRHKIAESRQSWIYRVIETLSEHHSIIMARPPGQALLPEDDRKLFASRTKLEILLNPDEGDTSALLEAIDKIDKSATAQDRATGTGEMLAVARRLLKREWVRIKDELSRI